MVEIKIFGRRDLEIFLTEHPKEYDVIHYTESTWPPLPFVKTNAKEWLHLPVDDIDHYEYKSSSAPLAEDVKKFIQFGSGREKLAIACAMGISRSTATAYVIGSSIWGPTEAIKLLEIGRSSPNRLIVYMGSQILGEPDIWNHYVKWLREYEGRDPSQGGVWPNSKLKGQMGLK